MSDSLNNKQMDEADAASEADTQRAIAEKFGALASVTEPTQLTEQEMLDRIELLGDEMDANDEENRAMQAEIDTLYAKIDAAKRVKN